MPNDVPTGPRGRSFLFVPGPTNISDRVLAAMHRPMEDHRSPGFPGFVRPLLADLATLFGTTQGEVLVFPASGTGGWEASLVNTCSPGDRLLAVRNGQFSHGFIDCARRHGLEVDVIDAEWGEAVPADRVHAALAADSWHQIKGLLVVHNETATGVVSDLATVRAAMDAASHPALLYADAVSGLGSMPLEMDRWGLDLVIAGSQKGLGLPPGLGIVAAGPRALEAMGTARCTRCFFDFSDMLRANAGGYFPYTPALSLLFGLRESLDALFEEGLSDVYACHHRLAEGVRAAVGAWGLRTCARRPEWCSDSVTAVMVPDGIDGAAVVDAAYRRWNLSLGGGLGKVAGRLFRIGHMGDLNELMLLGALAGAEMAMADVGIAIEPGSGVAAAAGVYRAGGA
jgi:alanine-glyoxylate transaminase/serine-glyoxylate transaminase/serine-pyruvate transaminase